MYTRILVPLDGSTLGEAILPHARDLAQGCGAELVLLRVAFAPIFPGTEPVDAQAAAIQEAETYVETVAKVLRDRGLKVEAKVRYGDPVNEILDHVTWGHIDLIAMATHGRTGLTRLVLGSVAERVLRRTFVPVLLVRAPAGVEA